MSDTSVQTAPGLAPPNSAIQGAEPASQTPRRVPVHPLWRVLRVLSSLRLTVVLFALSMVLVFFGTLAQIDSGIFTATQTYFRSVFVWIPFRLLLQFAQKFFFLSEKITTPDWFGFPFPGSVTLGSLLLVNLLAAHIVRFGMPWRRGLPLALSAAVVVYLAVADGVWWLLMTEWQLSFWAALPLVCLLAVPLAIHAHLASFPWKKAGMIVLHTGIIVLLIGELGAYFAVEGDMRIFEGESSNYVESTRHAELAIVQVVVDDNGTKQDDVTAVPAALLAVRDDTVPRSWLATMGRMFGKPAPLLKDERLPFDVEVVRYMVNSELRAATPDEANSANAGSGKTRIAEAIPEVSGTAADQTVDQASAYLKLTGRDGKDLGTYLFSQELRPQSVKVGDKTYEVSLRAKRSYRPFSLELKKFSADHFQGTEIARNYASDVVLHASNGVDRPLTIRMNEPLRYAGETFFQSSFGQFNGKYTVLHVVRNSSWRLPYVSCFLVSVGMLVHFCISLVTFLQRRVLA
jgi:ResB-like family